MSTPRELALQYRAMCARADAPGAVDPVKLGIALRTYRAMRGVKSIDIAREFVKVAGYGKPRVLACRLSSIENGQENPSLVYLMRWFDAVAVCAASAAAGDRASVVLNVTGEELAQLHEKAAARHELVEELIRRTLREAGVLPAARAAIPDEVPE